MQGTRTPGHRNVPHRVRPTYLLTARHKFPVCSREGKHPGQHQAGAGSQLGRFGTLQEGWEDPTWGTTGWAPSQPDSSRQLREERRATPAIPAAWHHRCARCRWSNCHWDGCQSSAHLQPPPLPGTGDNSICPLLPPHNRGGPQSPPTLVSPGDPPGWGEWGGRRRGATGATSRCSKATSLHPPTLISGGCLAKPEGFPLQRRPEHFKSVLLPGFLPGNKPRPGDIESKKKNKSGINGQQPKLEAAELQPPPLAPAQPVLWGWGGHDLLEPRDGPVPAAVAKQDAIKPPLWRPCDGGEGRGDGWLAAGSTRGSPAVGAGEG
ncbi:uncharacterized protein FN964_006116 [Alca torda]